jgi:hypothetical protein
MSYSDNEIAKEILEDYVQWALKSFMNQPGIKDGMIKVDPIPNPGIEWVDAVQLLKTSNSSLYNVVNPDFLTYVPSLLTGLSLDVNQVTPTLKPYYNNKLNNTGLNYQLPFMQTGKTMFYIYGKSNALYQTQDPTIFFGLFKTSGYSLLTLRITEVKTDYVSMFSNITIENKNNFLNQNIKWIKKCCVDSQLLGSKIKSILCANYSSDFYGFPSLQCDTKVLNYCKEHLDDPVCACFSTDPNVIGDGYDVIAWEYLKKNPTLISPKCVLNACKNNDAYKSAEMLREKCPHLCTSLLNIKNSGKSSIDINNVIIGVKCGSGKQHFGVGAGPKTLPGIDNKTKWWIYMIIVLVIAIVIGSIIFVIAKIKSRNNK